jgi:ubiquinone/menaquinone biosynthesis C-methylase UbiE
MAIASAERVTELPKDNYVFQRSYLAYVEASKIVSGDVLEIGTGTGYGIKVISEKAKKFVTIDKYVSEAARNLGQKYKNVEFLQMTVPSLTGIADESFDFVITFQVIEHIEDDHEFLKEINRVLKKGGKLIVTTPNKKMSITRNPWHVREYSVSELKDIMAKYFSKVQSKGVYGNKKIMDYYEANKASVAKITRFDIFDLQHRLPRRLLQIPYDILNSINRNRLANDNPKLVSDIKMEDYSIGNADDNETFDHFYIGTK